MIGNHGADPVGNDGAEGIVGEARDDEELLAAPAYRGVRLARRRDKNVPQLRQDAVAGSVPVAIVDLLEVVKIHHQEQQIDVGVGVIGIAQGEVPVVALNRGDVLVDMVDDVTPVSESGQCIGNRLIDQRGVGALQRFGTFLHQLCERLVSSTLRRRQRMAPLATSNSRAHHVR